MISFKLKKTRRRVCSAPLATPINNLPKMSSCVPLLAFEITLSPKSSSQIQWLRLVKLPLFLPTVSVPDSSIDLLPGE